MKKNGLISKTVLAAGMVMVLTACDITVTNEQPPAGNEEVNVQPNENEVKNVEDNNNNEQKTSEVTTDNKEDIKSGENEVSEVYKYTDLIAKYVDFLNTEQPEMADDISTGVWETAIYSEAPFSNLGYCITDISGDGNPEFLIISNEEAEYENNSRILAVYTVNENDEYEMVAEGWSRSRMYLLDDNKLYGEGSGGAAYSGWDIKYLDSDNKLVTERCVYTDSSVGDGLVYENTTGEWTYDNSELTKMSVKDAFDEADKYRAGARLIDITPFMEETESGSDIYICFSEEVINDVSDFQEFDLSASDNPVEVAIGSGNGLYDFCFYSLTVKDVTEDGISFDKEELFRGSKDMVYFPVIVKFDVMGDTPQYGFSCALEENGESHCYAINFSGKDGTPYIFEIF